MTRSLTTPAPRRRLVAFAAAAAGAALLAGCAGATPETPAETSAGAEVPAELTTITYGAFPVAVIAPVFLAQDEGIFAEHGLDMEPTFLNAVPDAVTAVASGQLDFSAINVVTLLQALEQGVPLQVVAPQNFSSPNDSALFVLPGSDITAEDFGGKRIGTVGLNNISMLAVQAMAKNAGVDPDTIEFVQMPSTQQAEALQQGQLDIASLQEPFITLAGDTVQRVDPKMDVLGNADNSSGIIAYYITSENMVTNKPEIVQAFGESILEAFDLANAQPDLLRQAILGFTEIDPAVAEKMILPTYSRSTGRASFEEWAQRALDMGYITKLPDFDALFAGVVGTP